jgi:hypothetical protein
MNLLPMGCTMVITDQSKANEASLTDLNSILPSKPNFRLRVRNPRIFCGIIASCCSLASIVPYLRAHIPADLTPKLQTYSFPRALPSLQFPFSEQDLVRPMPRLDLGIRIVVPSYHYFLGNLSYAFDCGFHLGVAFGRPTAPFSSPLGHSYQGSCLGIHSEEPNCRFCLVYLSFRLLVPTSFKLVRA